MSSSIQLVVFDWAGTTVDFGSQAPAGVFDRTFSKYGLHFRRDEINEPMGMEKRAHIRRMLSTDRGRVLWEKAQGRDWNEEDIEEIYKAFEEELNTVVVEYSQVIEGVPDVVEALRQKGLRIGSTTGYTSKIMEKVLPAAKDDGYVPDCVVTPSDTGYSRPTPFMLYECMRRTGVWPASRVVKVGDTTVDIREGKNAGAWAIGVLKASNLMGYSLEAYEEAPKEDRLERAERAKKAYLEAGADLVIDSILDLPEAIERLNAQIEAGEV